MPIQSGQTYRSADPRELIRIRIKSYAPGENRALVVDAATGKRPRPMLVTALHDSPITQAGKPRRSGYVLEQPSAGIRDAARQAAGHSCGNCDGVDPGTCLTNPDRQAAGQPPTEHVHRLGNPDDDGGILDDWDNCRDPECPGPIPAVEQPAEAQPATQGCLRDKLAATSQGAAGALEVLGFDLATASKQRLPADVRAAIRAHRAEILREAADAVDAGKRPFPDEVRSGASWAARMLRRMADEATP
ncbi:hypothetical protein [Streptomyces vilmorinianum]|uniref:hypothetical protein n=1 Tax=Streptomyces vilmorinianum TaxID=3051092 RepID=UPI0010FB6275|nr:hypothetical protein [Streptomyces vilmorinianum]